MLEKIEKEIGKLLQTAGVKGAIDLTIPPNSEMGDLAFACFGLAKERGKNSAEVAKEIAEKLLEEIKKLRNKEIIEDVKAAGPYVNFYLNAGEVAKAVIGDILKAKNNYGTNASGKGNKVLLEYPSNNTHKELHVGHLRTICIGNALTGLFTASGCKAVPVNYVNDFGAHVAKCLWGIMKFHKDEAPPENKQKWLGEIYTEAGKYLADHEEEKKEVEELQKKLEAKDKRILPLYAKTRKWSLDGFAKVFKELKVKHSGVFYEMDTKGVGQKMVDTLLKKKIAKKGERGAIIVDLTECGLDIALLRKSDGAGLYMTSDLGLAVKKNKLYPRISESIHITGEEQNFYFKQLFKVLELAGYKFKMTHIGHGLVNSSEGKMSSRAGNVILYEDLKQQVLEKVTEETKKKHEDWGDKKITQIAETLAFAAIKFDFLKHEAGKVIVFDINSAASFDGFTGPYVLYVVARINSLLRKSKVKSQKSKVDYELLTTVEEKQILMLLAQYPQVLEKALGNYNPSVVVKYAFDLAKQFNDFYNKHSVLSPGDKAVSSARLALSSAVKQVLENTLKILTIETVEEM